MIGTGSIIGDRHVPALNRIDNAVFWSVLSRDISRAKEFASNHGAAAPIPAFDDLKTFLADPSLDAVIIASPDKLHGMQITLRSAGKHVLVEKPMVTSHS